MLDKNYLDEVIASKFPDLDNTKIEIDGESISTFTLGKLLPFLVYQNTIDNNHRIIGLYLPEEKDTVNLLPFYVIMGQYRKLINTLMEENDFQYNHFDSHSINRFYDAVYNASSCKIISVDFINRQINLRTGRGNQINIPFSESYKISFPNSQNKLKQKIENLDDIDNARQNNIFTFPIQPNEKHYEGVLIFTNTSKFETLLKTIKVSGNDLRDHLNIEKVTFPNNEEDLKFVRLSRPSTAIKPVSVLIARQDAFKAFPFILSSAGSRLTHIKRIVIDDFDEILLKEDKKLQLENTLEEINEIYFNKLNGRILKDIYLISRNRNLNIHEFLTNFNVAYHPWLVKPLEAEKLNFQTINSPEIIFTNIEDSTFEELNSELTNFISRWKNLAAENYCNGEIIVPIKVLYDLRVKLNTFFKPVGIENFAKSISETLKSIKNKWFFSGQDFNLITETTNFLLTKLQSVSNYKLKVIIENLKIVSIKNILVVSNNNDDEDLLWFRDSILSEIPNINIHHSDVKSFLSKRQEENDNIFEIIYYLAPDKKLIGNSLGNILALKQIFVLSLNEYTYSCHWARKYQNLQTQIGNNSRKYYLLNLTPPAVSQEKENEELIPIKYLKKSIAKDGVNGQIVQEKIENIPELSEFIEALIIKNRSGNAHHSGSYTLFFDDGTFEILPESKRIYLYEDEQETEEVEKSLKMVSELEKGDEIILPKRKMQIKDLLEEALKKDQKFLRYIEFDLKWRMLIQKHIERCGMDLSFFRKKLMGNGFTIISDQTVQNWIDCETRRPDNFYSLLTALAELGIINKSDIDQYYYYNSELKSVQITFVRTAIRKLLLRIHGVEIENDQKFTDELLNNFIDHIEIKCISSIYKI
jgi:hypothetical protein